MFLCLFSSCLSFIVLVGFLVCYWRTLDADLTTVFCEIFGRKPRDIFRNKVIWITGAGTGIGRSIALYLATNTQCRLILTGRRTDKLVEVKLACLERSVELKEEDIFVLSADLTDFDQLPNVCQNAIQQYNNIDVVIHNAGQSQRAAWVEIDSCVDFECFKLNALAPVVLTRCLLPRLEKQKNGVQFIVVSSIAGLIGAHSSSSYSAAKHALNGYFRTLAAEKASCNTVKVSIVCPGSTFAPNNVHSAFTAQVGKAHGELLSVPTSSQMSSDRAAELICVVGANQISESWLSKQKSILFFTYLSLFCPGIVKSIYAFLGPERLRKMREG